MRNKKTLGWGELILGVLLIVLGIYSFSRPASALAGVTYLYGILALITGVIDIVFYVKLEQRTGFGPGLSLAGGILSVIAGLLILLYPSAGAWALMVLFPIWFIAHCISRLTRLPLIRLAGRSGYYYFTLILNILGIVLGFLMIVDPMISIFSIGYVIGIYLLFLGIDSLVSALDLLDSRY
ncbi:MAG: HdeD family acid-resistance protein [Candidatus Scatomorpha sp.]|jgi:uncharacterized membrane protein HdeD (DUF308 family)